MRIDIRTGYDQAAVEETQKTQQAQKPGVEKTAQGPHGGFSTDPASDVQLSGLQAKVASTPEIRQGRVQQLQQSIASGTYKVSDGQLAGAILGDSLGK